MLLYNKIGEPWLNKYTDVKRCQILW